MSTPALVLEARARLLLARPLVYADSLEFHDATPAWARSTLAPMPGLDKYEAARRTQRVPPSIQPHLHELFRWPLLSREQERHLFRQMNYLRHLEKVERDRMALGDFRGVGHALACRERADALLQWLVSANLRLVLKVSQKFSRFSTSEALEELLSDGNSSLISAAQKFDYTLGFKFSTYAYWAIKKNLGRQIGPRRRRETRFQTGKDEEVAEAAAAPDVASEDLDEAAFARRLVTDLLSYLEPRERAVVRLRRGLDRDGKPSTLLAVGLVLGITKERARQIEVAAQVKMADITRVMGHLR